MYLDGSGVSNTQSQRRDIEMKRILLILFIGLFFLSSCAKPAEAPTPTPTPDPIVTPEPEPTDKPVEVVDNDTIYQKFVKKLTKETLDRKLDWDNVFNIIREYEEDAFNYILTSNEFHTVYELQSYGLVKEDSLTIFLLNEEIESGMDGSVSRQKNLYVLEGIYGDSFKIPIEEKDLADLEGKIKYYFETEGADLDELNTLINEYLGE